MRITSGMITSRYVRDLNNGLSNLNNLSRKVETGRKFFKGSEDPVSAVKAYRLRRETVYNEDVKKNIGEADSQLLSAESSLMGLRKGLTTAKTQTLKGINGTMSSGDRKIIATKLRNIQETMINTMNAEYDGKYVFGGSSMEKPPFEKNSAGDLIYKGVNVSNITSSDTAGMAKLDKMSKERFYVDLGLSLDLNPDGTVNENTVFDISMPGIEFLGYGSSNVDGKEVPNNLYDIIGNICDNLENENFDFDDTSKLIKQFDDKVGGTLKQVTTIGTKTKYIDFLKSRADTEELNLATKTKAVEFMDPAKAIMDWKMQEYAYNSALSMGNKILQPSFLDFMK